ncbi:hypothetical protein DPEC_G00124830 [Dallia pectoralis]|uniref:Uncharacterized protein n=1 Tax=Dallia pectoralis TaxID=75939 RepID=A0ACC2GR65_DALPE|nr:hypothetical protein DPEC_G00124830 [Dallia pectoralis]
MSWAWKPGAVCCSISQRPPVSVEIFWSNKLPVANSKGTCPHGSGCSDWLVFRLSRLGPLSYWFTFTHVPWRVTFADGYGDMAFATSCWVLELYPDLPLGISAPYHHLIYLFYPGCVSAVSPSAMFSSLLSCIPAGDNLLLQPPMGEQTVPLVY